MDALQGWSFRCQVTCQLLIRRSTRSRNPGNLTRVRGIIGQTLQVISAMWASGVVEHGRPGTHCNGPQCPKPHHSRDAYRNDDTWKTLIVRHLPSDLRPAPRPSLSTASVTPSPGNPSCSRLLATGRGCDRSRLTGIIHDIRHETPEHGTQQAHRNGAAHKKQPRSFNARFSGR